VECNTKFLFEEYVEIGDMFRVPGSRLWVPGSEFRVQGSEFPAPVAQVRASGLWESKPGDRKD
jgi:hypothetical protein